MKKRFLIAASLLLSISIFGALMLAIDAGPARASFERDAESNVQLSSGRTKRADPGQSISYTHVVTNTGETTYTFEVDVSAPSSWPVTLLTGQWPGGTAYLPVSLGPDMTKTFAVSLTVPSMTPSGDFETVVKVMSDTEPLDVATDTTTVNKVVTVTLSSAEGKSGVEPGEVVTYLHTITNAGEITDTFELKASSSQGWPVELFGGNHPAGTPGMITFEQLADGDSENFTVSITVPTTATAGSVDHTRITATSQFDSEAQAIVTDTTRLQSYIYLPLVVRNYPPAWEQADNTDNISFYDITVCPSRPRLQYAGTTSRGFYRSDDGGEAWEYWGLDGWATPVVLNPSDCGEVFVAAWGEGVYSVKGQPSPINQGLGDLYLYSLAVGPSKALYAGSNSHGVYKTDMTDVNWSPVNNGISDLRIRSLYVISDTLYAGGRQCTYYYSDDGASSWNSETVLDGGKNAPCEDAQVWAIAKVGDVLYASLGLNKGLYRRPEASDWEQVDMPAVDIFQFGLLSHQSRLYVGTYGHGVYVCEPNGQCRPLPNGGLGSSKVRGLATVEIDNEWRLLAGSDDGIWWVPLIR